MHVIFRESHGLEEADTPRDLGQDPADLLILSYSDSDLSGFAAAWHRLRALGPVPSLRLANLADLRHPLSVDTWVEATATGAKLVLIRLIGGESYWPYGLASLRDLAQRGGPALAVLPADGRPDARLDALSTVPGDMLSRLRASCDQGGEDHAMAALALLSGTIGQPLAQLGAATALPDFGWHDAEDAPEIVVTFYRSYLAAADTAPVDALLHAFRARGLRAAGFFAPSLKHPAAAAHLREALCAAPPRAIVNATAFSARGATGSPLDVTGCPVFQVALSTADRDAWAGAERGLSPADLAMHVVLPEVDGRIFAGLISHKQKCARDPDLQFARAMHAPDAALVTAAADRVMGWLRLAAGTPRRGIILSTYPGKDWQMGHAVGLDVIASVKEMLGTACADDLPGALQDTIRWPLADYRAALARLPQALRDDLTTVWGAQETDPDIHDGMVHFRAARAGRDLIALQPERGQPATRESDYHDLSRVPRHAYVAFYLWLQARCDALIHMGAHGTLEWLPGKAVALSDTCWPQALAGGLPVIYPFIVNDPGEAAQARRRIGAVTLGHMPPPLAPSATPPGMARLESLLDEYSTADGLDPARRDRLIGAIRDEARALGVEADLDIPASASAAEAIPRIDRFVCDIKESQYGDGLHVLGTGPCGAEERAGLAAALAGRRVEPGPAGSPFRGRQDVLPTGRNLFATDPRTVPSRAAHAQGVKLAEELLRRHLQDHGDWPGALVVDLWGSATMRTAGEELAMALQLAGLAPRWDAASDRVSGFSIIPLAELGRPRILVTLRISGLFRDVFPGLAQLFQQATEALAARVAEGVEAADQNPYRARPQVFGPRPGSFGLGMGDAPEDYANGRARAGEAWLSGSEWAFDATGGAARDRGGIERAVTGADAFVHPQDMPETDLLLATDYAAHEGGFAAARDLLGAAPIPLYHLDATNTDAPRARPLPEEIARVVRARAADPGWANGMMRHGFRGAAEIAATLDHMAAFQNLAGAVGPHLFDSYWQATLGRPEVTGFMAQANPGALEALRARFTALHRAGLWISRRNSILAELADD